ncbi:hypothetical protein ABLE91_04140 [Aquabacter sp. CN5-332]
MATLAAQIRTSQPVLLSHSRQVGGEKLVTDIQFVPRKAPAVY